jgi:dTDP-4-dehydrorhamnose reductase
MKRVVVLGGSGMLGSMVADVLARTCGLAVQATARNARLCSIGRERLSEIEWVSFDCSDERTWTVLDGSDWIINAIGITKPLIRDDNGSEIERAIAINAAFPYRLGRAAETCGARVLQIATDCVYSGARGGYTEDAPHDALDVYGKSKSLGEARLPNVHHLRCSIIGPEPKEHKFLIDWFLRQPQRAQVNGFTNHQWNGVTTLHFARICSGIVAQEIDLPHLQHIIPGNTLTKAHMLQVFAHCYHREDIQIHPLAAPTVINRTLRTTNPALNQTLWAAAGYAAPPTVEAMISELAHFEPRLTRLD